MASLFYHTFEELEGRTNCQSVTVLLESSLVKTSLQKYYNPGSRVRVNGIIYDKHIYKNRQKDVKMDLIIEANYIEPQGKTNKINISPEDKKVLKKISEDKEYIKKLIDSFMPDLVDIDFQKLAVLLSLVKGGNAKREEIHLLFAEVKLS